MVARKIPYASTADDAAAIASRNAGTACTPCTLAACAKTNQSPRIEEMKIPGDFHVLNDVVDRKKAAMSP